jgi:MFS family permease
MAVLIFGGLALQWPIGHLADRYDRKRVLMFASIMTTLVGALLPHAGSSWGMYLLAWFFGGFSFTIYPLSMAYTCEGLQEEWIVPATGGFVLSYSIGAIGGPVIAPLAMALFGPGGIFYFIGALTFSLALFGWLYREGLKNWETGKEAASIFQSGKSGHALEHAANEDEKLKAKPTSPETNSSVTSGITKNPTR